MILKKNVTENKWTNFINETNQKNVYSSYKYLKCIKKKFNNYILYENNLPIVGAILFEENLNEIPIFYNSLFISNKIKSPHKLNQVCTKFLHEVLNYDKKIHLRSHYSLKDIRSFQWLNYFSGDINKFKINIFYTSILEIGKIDKEDIFKKFNSSRRNIINSSINNGFFSKISNDVQILNDLNKKTYDRKRSKNEKLMATEIAERSIKSKIATLMVTFDKNKNPLAASLFLHDDETSYYSVGGSYTNIKKSGASSLNIYDQIINAKNQKNNIIDFVGINSPDRGYFKTSFGGNSEIYFDLKYK